MVTVGQAFATALQHHQAGRLEAAGRIYRQILVAEPTHADALHLFGIVNAQTGHRQLAVECIRRALTLRPDWAEAHANLGNALREQGKPDEAVPVLQRALQLKPHDVAAINNLGNAFRDLGNLDEAVACYRRAMELKPDFAEALGNLGTALKDQGNLEEAIACYRRAVELKPDHAVAHYNLGTALGDLADLDEAIRSYRCALDLRPDYAQAHNNLANALKSQGQIHEAVAAYRRALELKPDYLTALNNLGLALADLGKRDEAIGYYRRALELRPDSAEARYHLGMVLHDLGRVNEAITCYRRALELNPDLAAAHNNLGNAYKNQGLLPAAFACYRRALELKPDYAEAYNNLGNAFKDQGDLDQAIACHRRALELKPDYAVAHSNLLYTLHYCQGVTLASLAEAHAGYNRQHAVPLYRAEERAVKIRDAGDPPRLGFISPDLGRHPVGFFLVRVLESLRQEQHETICYSDRIIKDDLSHRLQAAATGWRDVNGLSDERLAEQVRADEIDILFDLAGHTAHNRLLVFARKPAPIQISWIGYVGTTGLQVMDYILADRYEIPPDGERYYCEPVLRMPHGYVCYDPPSYAHPVSHLPALERRYVTFGSINNPAKIGPGVVEVWARILHRLPEARLVLKYKGMDEPALAGRLTSLFAAGGIDGSRLEFLGKSPHPDSLAHYHRIDIALDPFPYNGGLTTCEALWMGVPVITWPSETFAGRHSLSHLSSVGLTQTIARDADEYVELAVSLANDLPRLAAMRAGLRDQMAESPLCDGPRFAADLMSVLYDVWERNGGEDRPGSMRLP
ncbi:MAG: tetratricopeptide repeat protein [Isosphaeraceae bacterium]